MADIFREVDEEVRREQLARIWKKYGPYIVAAVVLLVAAVAGWRGYQYWQNQRAAEAGAKFEAALTLSEEKKHEEAREAFARIASEGVAGYRPLARLQEAQEVAERDRAGAVAIYDALAADGSVSQEFRDLAAIRAGFLLVDTASLADMTARLEALANGTSTFRHTARELLALSAFRNGDLEATRRLSETILGDAATPQNLRTRTEVLRSLSGLDAKS